jgi:hypothetical protein
MDMAAVADGASDPDSGTAANQLRQMWPNAELTVANC